MFCCCFLYRSFQPHFLGFIYSGVCLFTNVAYMGLEVIFTSRMRIDCVIYNILFHCYHDIVVLQVNIIRHILILGNNWPCLHSYKVSVLTHTSYKYIVAACIWQILLVISFPFTFKELLYNNRSNYFLQMGRNRGRWVFDFFMRGEREKPIKVTGSYSEIGV